MRRFLIYIVAVLCLPFCAMADEALDNYSKGVKLYWDGNGAEALPYLEKSLGLGCTDAAYIIGELYTWGIGIPKNYAKAENYYKMAANSKVEDSQNRTEARFSIWILHQMDVSTLTEKEAAQYLCEAANDGLPDALYELGLYYKRHAKFGNARKAMNEAVEKGSVHALSHMGLAWYEGNRIWTLEGIDYEKAFQYLSEAAEDIEQAPITNEMKCAVYLTLSKCYRFGRGVKADIKKANDCNDMAAKYGDPTAIDVKKILN
ncbi:MAG: sel1 repeat family protein [Bacteroides sp.]|nr:sel1 repeat family protein [Bacteroides sp.]